jgi:hypothetical protein
MESAQQLSYSIGAARLNANPLSRTLPVYSEAPFVFDAILRYDRPNNLWRQDDERADY